MHTLVTTLPNLAPISGGCIYHVLASNRSFSSCFIAKHLSRHTFCTPGSTQQGDWFAGIITQASHQSYLSAAAISSAALTAGLLQCRTAQLHMGKVRRGITCAAHSPQPDAASADHKQQQPPSNGRSAHISRQQAPAAEQQSISAATKRRKAVSTTDAAQSTSEIQGTQDSAVVTGKRRRRRQATDASTSSAAVVHVKNNVAGTAADCSGAPLLDLGPIIAGELVKRPSGTVKTPYVSDVKLPDGTIVLAHTPSLDCAGMIKPGSTVHMTVNVAKAAGQQTTKTTHAVQLAEDHREDGQSTLVGAHPYLAERLAEAAVQQHLLPLPPSLQGYTQVLKQQTVGLGRFDFVLCYADGSQLLLEVKNAVCADFPAGQVPEGRGKPGKNGVYISTADPYVRTALFPIGSKQKPIGVVSDRAIKHLHELIQLQKAEQDSTGRTVKCAVLFIINRGDCSAFRPCDEADQMFAQMLHKAQQSGVLVMAHDVRWEAGQAVWGKQLPVVFSPGIDGADVDNEQLQAVLSFNATNPRTRWKTQKKEKIDDKE